MSKFKIVPLQKSFASTVRRTMTDGFGHPVIEQVATGRGPCRVSLRPFQVGVESRLLLSYNPFSIKNAYNHPGPVFINKAEVEPYDDIHRFPPEIKADREHFHLTLIGYDSAQMMAVSRLVGDDDVDELIIKIFDQYPRVEYLHARSAEACCYICKIERA